MATYSSNITTWLCRGAFVALCVVPTCAAVALTVAVHLPGYRRSQEAAISAALGCQAHLESCTALKPGSALYQGVTLTDADNGQRLADLPCVEVQSSNNGTALKFALPATLNGDRLDAIWLQAQSMLRNRELDQPVRLDAKNVTVRLRDGAWDLSFTDLVGQLQADSDTATLTLDFLPASAQKVSGKAAQLHVSRHRTTPATTVVRLTTGDSPLPCALLIPILGASADLGSAATFEGQITWTQSSAGSLASVRGLFRDLDLDRLCRRATPHHLAARGELRLVDATIRDGRIETASGRLSTGPGQISHSLLAAAQQHLGFLTRQGLAGLEAVSFQSLELEFSLDGQGVVLAGVCSERPGAVMLDIDRRILVQQGATSLQPAINLLYTLAPGTPANMPWVKETDWLARRLPLPSASVTGNEEPQIRARTLGVRRQ